MSSWLAAWLRTVLTFFLVVYGVLMFAYSSSDWFEKIGSFTLHRLMAQHITAQKHGRLASRPV